MRKSDIELYAQITRLRHMISDMVKKGSTLDGTDDIQREISLQAKFLMNDISKVLHV